MFATSFIFLRAISYVEWQDFLPHVSPSQPPSLHTSFLPSFLYSFLPFLLCVIPPSSSPQISFHFYLSLSLSLILCSLCLQHHHLFILVLFAFNPFLQSLVSLSSLPSCCIYILLTSISNLTSTHSFSFLISFLPYLYSLLNSKCKL